MRPPLLVIRKLFRTDPAPPEPDRIHLETAALLLGLKVFQVQMLAAAGVLRYARVDGQMMVNEADVARLAARWAGGDPPPHQ